MKLKKGDKVILGKNRYGDYYRNKIVTIVNIDIFNDKTRYYVDYNNYVRMFVYEDDIQHKIPYYSKNDMVICDLYINKDFFKNKIGKIIEVYPSTSIKNYTHYNIQFLEKFSQYQFNIVLTKNCLIVSEEYILENVKIINVGDKKIYKGIKSGINYDLNPKEEFYNSFGIDPKTIVDKYDIVELGTGDIFTINKTHLRPLVNSELIIYLDNYDTHIVDIHVFYSNNYEKIKNIINKINLTV